VISFNEYLSMFFSRRTAVVYTDQQKTFTSAYSSYLVINFAMQLSTSPGHLCLDFLLHICLFLSETRDPSG